MGTTLSRNGTATAGMAAGEKRTFRVKLPAGPLIVDLWEARRPVDAPPILLIHGWGGTGSYWADTARALSETVPVYVPDLPGTGRSQPLAAPQSMFDQVNALTTMIDALEIDRVQLVGHSMGGAMSLLVADAIPEKIDRVVLTSTCFFLTEEQERVYESVMKFIHLAMHFRAPWMAELPLLPRMMARRYFHHIPGDRALLKQGLRDYLEMDYATAIASSNEATNKAIPEAGARLQAPALLIACRQDQVMPVENVDYTAETIPDCTVRWMDQCGHMPMVEKPAEYLGHLREFLRLN